MLSGTGYSSQTISTFLGVDEPRNVHDTALEPAPLVVEEPVLRGTNKLNHYHEYKVVAPGLPVMGEVFRRYSEFVWLRTTFFKMWPGIFVPPLPPKVLNKTRKGVLTERQAGLQMFLRQVSTSPYLTKTVIWKNFLCNSTYFESFVKQTNKELSVSIDLSKDVFARYTRCFPGHDEPLSSEEDEQVMKLRVYFSEMAEKLETVSESMEVLANANKTACEELHLFNKQVGQIYSAEKQTSPDEQSRQDRIDVTDTFARVSIAREDDDSYHTLANGFARELAITRAIVDVLDSVATIATAYEKALANANRPQGRKSSIFGSALASFGQGNKKSEKEQKDEDQEKAQILTKIYAISARVMLLQQIPCVLMKRNTDQKASFLAFADQQQVVAREARAAWQDLMVASR